MVLGRIEGDGRRNLADDRLPERLGLLQRRPGGLGDAQLRTVVCEDARAVLRADIAQLAIDGGLVDGAPESLA